MNVHPAEYLRLLGYPRDHVPTGRAAELMDWARDWYNLHGRPWTHTREISLAELAEFNSPRLRTSLQEAQAHGAIVAAVSAGPEAEEHAQKLWQEEKPDEYFFLEIYAAAVVEHLITAAGARLCESAEKQGMGVLPHYSPGYAGWDIGEQGRLLALMGPLPGKLEALESGALVPKKSQLAVFGLTRHTANLRRLTDMLPCENCSYGPCEFRRGPYRHAAGRVTAAYTINVKALKRWSADRLTLEMSDSGAIEARFRYDGTTCTNLGRPLAFDYTVKLGPRESGYPILEQSCAPAAGDTGHTQMCQYVADAEPLMEAIRREKPLAGQPLGDVLAWRRATTGSGCYCDPASREHKWGLVLETIHYALHETSIGSH